MSSHEKSTDIREVKELPGVASDTPAGADPAPRAGGPTFTFVTLIAAGERNNICIGNYTSPRYGPSSSFVSRRSSAAPGTSRGERRKTSGDCPVSASIRRLRLLVYWFPESPFRLKKNFPSNFDELSMMGVLDTSNRLSLVNSCRKSCDRPQRQSHFAIKKRVSKSHRAGRGKTLRAQMYACYLYGLTLPPDRTVISRTRLSFVITIQIFVQMMECKDKVYLL
ncbi:hypothetical protein EVAR_14957_1 [Eumeta japonica]|uniref:Uncharacterized protein n=1 Tax=Eumeta variegata TaxID=151549 RepID=A0A4C1XLX3_EUMVA|nr:hypothetical protein EVAR_14957_1 [Eumeta japonica]